MHIRLTVKPNTIPDHMEWREDCQRLVPRGFAGPCGEAVRPEAGQRKCCGQGLSDEEKAKAREAYKAKAGM